MNRREFLAVSTAGAVLLPQSMRAFAAPNAKIASRNRCFQSWRADYSAHLWRLHGAGHHAGVGRDVNGQEIRQPDYQCRAAAGEFLFPPLCRRAVQADRSGQLGRDGHCASVCRPAQPTRDARRFRASRHSAIQAACGTRQIVCGPHLSRRRSWRQACGSPGVGTWTERFAGDRNPVALE